MKFLAGIFAFILIFSGCAAPSPSKRNHVLFSVDAEEMLLLPMKPPLNKYTLHLKVPSDRVFLFEGWPMSQQTTLSVPEFFKAWSSKQFGLHQTPPRAALIAYVSDRKGKMDRLSVVVKLSKPSYNTKTGELTFEAVAISRISHWLVGHPVQLADLIIETQKKIENKWTSVNDKSS